MQHISGITGEAVAPAIQINVREDQHANARAFEQFQRAHAARNAASALLDRMANPLGIEADWPHAPVRVAPARGDDPDELVSAEHELERIFRGALRAAERDVTSIHNSGNEAAAARATVAAAQQFDAYAAETKREHSRLLREAGTDAAEAYLRARPSNPFMVKAEPLPPDPVPECIAAVMELLGRSVLGQIPGEPAAFPDVREQLARLTRDAQNRRNQYVGRMSTGGHTLSRELPEDQRPTVAMAFRGVNVPRGYLRSWLSDHGITR